MKDAGSLFDKLKAEYKRLQETIENLNQLNADWDEACHKLERTLNMLLNIAHIAPAVRGIILSERDLLDSPEGREFLEHVKKRP